MPDPRLEQIRQALYAKFKERHDRGVAQGLFNEAFEAVIGRMPDFQEALDAEAQAELQRIDAAGQEALQDKRTQFVKKPGGQSYYREPEPDRGIVPAAERLGRSIAGGAALGVTSPARFVGKFVGPEGWAEESTAAIRGILPQDEEGLSTNPLLRQAQHFLETSGEMAGTAAGAAPMASPIAAFASRLAPMAGMAAKSPLGAAASNVLRRSPIAAAEGLASQAISLPYETAEDPKNQLGLAAIFGALGAARGGRAAYRGKQAEIQGAAEAAQLAKAEARQKTYEDYAYTEGQRRLPEGQAMNEAFDLAQPKTGKIAYEGESGFALPQKEAIAGVRDRALQERLDTQLRRISLLEKDAIQQEIYQLTNNPPDLMVGEGGTVDPAMLTEYKTKLQALQQRLQAVGGPPKGGGFREVQTAIGKAKARTRAKRK